MVSSTTRGAFDPRCAGMEAVVALEHGLLKAQESGLFAPGELLITAVSTKDMLVCYAGGGCADVLGAPAEALMCTSLFDGLHAEDVRNLVFAFHLFPTILPEMANLAGAENDKPAWEREREAALDQGKERLLPLPDAARLLPHGYLRRRLADGRFIGMERRRSHRHQRRRRGGGQGGDATKHRGALLALRKRRQPEERRVPRALVRVRVGRDRRRARVALLRAAVPVLPKRRGHGRGEETGTGRGHARGGDGRRDRDDRDDRNDPRGGGGRGGGERQRRQREGGGGGEGEGWGCADAR